MAKSNKVPGIQTPCQGRSRRPGCSWDERGSCRRHGGIVEVLLPNAPGRSWEQDRPCSVLSISHFLFSFKLIYVFNWRLITTCFQTVVLQKTLESPLDCKEIKPVNPKGNQPWIFTGRTDAEALVLWPPDEKKMTHWKIPWCWERSRQEEKGVTEDEIVGWHHWPSGHEFEWTVGDSEGQGRVACCSPWGHRVGRNRVTTKTRNSVQWRKSIMFLN